MENLNNDIDKVELYKFRIFKNFIKENVVCEKRDLKIDNIFFKEDLLKLIRYIDTEFYNELQQGAEQ